MNYEYLKPFFEGGPLSFEQLTEKLDAADGVKLANLKDGGYVGKDKFDALEARANGLQAQLSEANGKLEGYDPEWKAKLFAWLYSVVRDKKTLTDVEKTFCCVNIFAESEGKYDAWTQKAIVAVQSYGGSTKGLQLPYNIHWIGERTYGAAAITAGKLTFTPGSSALEG